MLERLGKLPCWSHWVILLAGCSLYFFVWIGHVPLTEIDEARFTEATREMVVGGDYIIPHFNWEPRYRKPVLIYWLQARSMKLFGQTETAARVPSGLATTLIVLLTYSLLRNNLLANAEKDHERRANGAALLGAAAMITIPLAAVWSRAAVSDGVLTFWITVSLLCLFKADLAGAATPGERNRSARNWYWLASISAGMAFLTKGPIGIAIPFIAWMFYHIRQRDLWRAARQMPWITAIGLFILVGAPWYVATYLVDGPAFLKWFFLRENVERYTSTMHGWGGKFPFCLMWYPLASLLLAFPLSAYLVHDLISPFGGNRSMCEQNVLLRLRRFAWCWVLAVIGVFSLSRTQFPHYVHSIIGGVGILFTLHLYGRFLREEEPRGAARGVETGLLALFGTAFAGLLIRSLMIGQGKGGRIGEYPYPELAAKLILGILVVAWVIFMIGVVCRRVRVSWTLSGWAITMAAVVLGIGPMFVRSIYQPTVEMGEYLKSLPSDKMIISFCCENPEGLVFYSERRIEFFARKGGEADPLSAVTEKIKEAGDAVVVTDDSGMEELRDVGNVALLKLKSIGKSVVVEVVSR